MTQLRNVVLLLLLASITWAQTPNATNPANSQALFKQASELFAKEDYGNAARLYRQVLQDKSTRMAPFAWYNLGHCMVRLNKLPLAAIAYKRAVETAPAFSRPYRALGDVHFQLKAPAEAMVWYLRTLEREKDDPSLYLNLGETALMAGDAIEAVKWFEKYRSVDPYRPEVYFAIADAYQRIKAWDDASEVLQEALRRAPTGGAKAWFLLGQLRLKTGQDSAALVAFEEGLVLEPGNRNQRRFLASQYVKRGQSWKAQWILEEGIDRNAEDQDLLLDLGDLFFRQNRFDEAYAAFKKAEKAGSVIGRMGAQNCILTLAKQGRVEEAEALRRKDTTTPY